MFVFQIFLKCQNNYYKIQCFYCLEPRYMKKIIGRRKLDYVFSRVKKPFMKNCELQNKKIFKKEKGIKFCIKFKKIDSGSAS